MLTVSENSILVIETEDREVTIRDMRRLADELSLDRHGFELRRHETVVEEHLGQPGGQGGGQGGRIVDNRPPQSHLIRDDNRGRVHEPVELP